MRHHAKGVTVITAGTEVPIGFCATSLASVSLDPPIVSFTVGLRATSWATVEADISGNSVARPGPAAVTTPAATTQRPGRVRAVSHRPR